MVSEVSRKGSEKSKFRFASDSAFASGVSPLSTSVGIFAASEPTVKTNRQTKIRGFIAMKGNCCSDVLCSSRSTMYQLGNGTSPFYDDNFTPVSDRVKTRSEWFVSNCLTYNNKFICIRTLANRLDIYSYISKKKYKLSPNTHVVRTRRCKDKVVILWSGH